MHTNRYPMDAVSTFSMCSWCHGKITPYKPRPIRTSSTWGGRIRICQAAKTFYIHNDDFQLLHTQTNSNITQTEKAIRFNVLLWYKTLEFSDVFLGVYDFIYGFCVQTRTKFYSIVEHSILNWIRDAYKVILIWDHNRILTSNMITIIKLYSTVLIIKKILTGTFKSVYWLKLSATKCVYALWRNFCNFKKMDNVLYMHNYSNINLF